MIDKQQPHAHQQQAKTGVSPQQRHGRFRALGFFLPIPHRLQPVAAEQRRQQCQYQQHRKRHGIRAKVRRHAAQHIRDRRIADRSCAARLAIVHRLAAVHKISSQCIHQRLLCHNAYAQRHIAQGCRRKRMGADAQPNGRRQTDDLANTQIKVQRMCGRAVSRGRHRRLYKCARRVHTSHQKANVSGRKAAPGQKYRGIANGRTIAHPVSALPCRIVQS